MQSEAIAGISLQSQDLAGNLARMARQAEQLSAHASSLYRSQSNTKQMRDQCVQAETSTSYQPLKSRDHAH